MGLIGPLENSRRLRILITRLPSLLLVLLAGIWLIPLSGLVTAQESGPQRLLSVPEDNLPTELPIDAIPKGFSASPIAPKNNPTTPEKVQLGRRLFFDQILSRDGTVACATCHRPDQGFASSNPVAVGIDGRVGKRNAPSILNRGYGTHFLWDGSATSLEDQALTPISNPDEFGTDIETVLKSLRSDSSYRDQFARAFGESDSIEQVISAERLAKAIASFERTLVYGNTRVDRFRASEYGALSREARQGMWIFESSGGCWKCHGGEIFSDEKFHNTGVDFENPNRDVGRFAVTKDEKDNFKFKTPSLRGISLTAPYMHDGGMKTLREVVEFYNKGGAPGDPNLDNDIQRLNLSDKEVGFLVEFLKALSQEQ